uniref:Uncharacterized protein n=1 Tax=Mustela putorius furo TaxID=9669 RepID=M3YSU0_MUSPF
MRSRIHQDLKASIIQLRRVRAPGEAPPLALFSETGRAHAQDGGHLGRAPLPRLRESRRLSTPSLRAHTRERRIPRGSGGVEGRFFREPGQAGPPRRQRLPQGEACRLGLPWRRRLRLRLRRPPRPAACGCVSCGRVRAWAPVMAVRKMSIRGAFIRVHSWLRFVSRPGCCDEPINGKWQTFASPLRGFHCCLIKKN